MAMTEEHRIRRRAYEIWEREGRPEGREEEHWHQAVQEVRAEQASGTEGETIAKRTMRKQAAARTADKPSTTPRTPKTAARAAKAAEPATRKPRGRGAGRGAEDAG